ncbi:MAG: OsmC family protein [Bacteroidetes bacterium]|nr:OsmC family protein [Bacteroidota bacterium]MBS1629458.1 OsmC family protein [Bacteroidota bacterium]
MPVVTVQWVKPEYCFEARDEAGLTMHMDSSAGHGGQGFGVSPMQSLLMALGGCSGIDIISILTKQRQSLSGLRIRVRGEREKEVTPALWKLVHVEFFIPGIEKSKAEFAAKLSIDKYCSVAETLRRAGCVITWELVQE